MTLRTQFVDDLPGIPERFSRWVLALFGDRSPLQVCLAVVAINLCFIGVALLLPPAREFPTYHFQGLRLISFVSLVQLVVISALAYQVYRERLVQEVGPSEGSRGPGSSRFWLVICLGFCFMSIDEVAAIHVHLDRAIHALANRSGRTRSVTISLYAVGAFAVLVLFRREFLAFRRVWLPFGAAFSCLVLAIAFDSMAIYRIEPWLPKFTEILLSRSGRGVTEEALELFSECFFITAMYASVVEARRLGEHGKVRAE